jgi:hypothetical protein
LNALEHCARSFARRTTQDGIVVLITNGHPALEAAFKELGWSDPYPDPLLLPAKPTIIDELHQHKDGKLAQALKDAPKGKR